MIFLSTIISSYAVKLHEEKATDKKHSEVTTSDINIETSQEEVEK